LKEDSQPEYQEENEATRHHDLMKSGSCEIIKQKAEGRKYGPLKKEGVGRDTICELLTVLRTASYLT